MSAGQIGQAPWAQTLAQPGAGSGGGGGGASTLAAAYTIATAPADNTATLVTGKGGIFIDGTGATTLDPLVVRNGKAGSGIVVRVTGTARTGFIVQDASGTQQSALGLAVAAGDWSTGSPVGSTVLTTTAGGIYIRPASGGVRIHSAASTNLTTGAWGQFDDGAGTNIGYASQNWAFFGVFYSSINAVASQGLQLNTLATGLGVQIASGPVAIARGALGPTSGATVGLSVNASFVPSSGAGSYAHLDTSFTVNQTGTSSGTVTGIYQNITATATLGTLRALWLQKGGSDLLSIKPAQASSDMVVDWNTQTEYSEAHRIYYRLAGTALATSYVLSAGGGSLYLAALGATGVANFGAAAGGKASLSSGSVVFMAENGNGALFAAGGTTYGSGAKVLFVANATTVPTSNPTGGGILYAEAGALKWRGSGGTITVVAPA